MLPTGPAAGKLIALMDASKPVVAERSRRGRFGRDADLALGSGRTPALPRFAARYGVDGRLSSAVDLVRGLGVLTGHRRRRRAGRDRRLRQRLRRAARRRASRRSPTATSSSCTSRRPTRPGTRARRREGRRARAVGRRHHRAARRSPRRASRAACCSCPTTPRRARSARTRPTRCPYLLFDSDARRRRAASTPSGRRVASSPGARARAHGAAARADLPRRCLPRPRAGRYSDGAAGRSGAATPRLRPRAHRPSRPAWSPSAPGPAVGRPLRIPVPRRIDGPDSGCLERSWQPCTDGTRPAPVPPRRGPREQRKTT